jgi:hypothetical protein
MRKLFALFALAALTTTGAFAHGGKSHSLMGTVKHVHENQLTITTTANAEATVTLTSDTKLEQDGKPADRSALVEGARVSIQLEEDDKTAVKVKIGAGGQHQH